MDDDAKSVRSMRSVRSVASTVAGEVRVGRKSGGLDPVQRLSAG